MGFQSKYNFVCKPRTVFVSPRTVTAKLFDDALHRPPDVGRVERDGGADHRRAQVLHPVAAPVRGDRPQADVVGLPCCALDEAEDVAASVTHLTIYEGAAAVGPANLPELDFVAIDAGRCRGGGREANAREDRSAGIQVDPVAGCHADRARRLRPLAKGDAAARNGSWLDTLLAAARVSLHGPRDQGDHRTQHA